MKKRFSALLFLSVVSCACRPTAPARYVPTVDEAAWEAAHDAENLSDREAALRGYTRLCERPEPYVRACLDSVRLRFKLRPIEEARLSAIEFITRFPDEGYAQSAVKRLARSFSKNDEYEEGFSTLTALSDKVRKTEIRDTVLYETARLARKFGDGKSEENILKLLVKEYGRWESQLWDDAVWRLSEIARDNANREAEKKWLRTLLNVQQDSWLIGSYTTPFHGDTLLRLGYLLLGESKPTEALTLFEQAVELRGSRVVDEALLGAAKAHIALGQKSAACRTLAKVLSRDTSKRYLNQARTLELSLRCISR